MPHPRLVVTTVIICLAITRGAAAQDWSIDARDIALGGTGKVRPLATTMERFEKDTVVVVPFGLLQVLKDFGIYNPKSPRFDPVRGGAYLSSPMHFMLNRDAVPNASDNDTPGGFSGFEGAGVFAPRIGRVWPIRRDGLDRFQGLYVGAGPYLGVRATAIVPETEGDQTVLAGVDAQFAAAITVGYRGRFTAPARRVTIDLAFDYSFLRGVFYNRDDVDIVLPTGDFSEFPQDAIGQARRSRSTSGFGRAIGIAAGMTIGRRWGVGVGIEGIANKIRWKDVHGTATVDFPITHAPLPADPEARVDVDIRMPLDYRARFSYLGDKWVVSASVGHRFTGANANAGVERRLRTIAIRAGLRYDYGRWSPAAGVGIPLSTRVSLDVAAFGTTANLARRQTAAIAFSFRIRPASAGSVTR